MRFKNRTYKSNGGVLSPPGKDSSSQKADSFPKAASDDLTLSDLKVRRFLRSFDTLKYAVKTHLDVQNNYL
ncbi:MULTISPECIES: hypothetical protein, partial [unclassified Microcoleus]|uniref:hypothetical protein n=1 Tax=unclassified Microcoleus TaxID=2642155 RepID=UPI0025EC32F4